MLSRKKLRIIIWICIDFEPFYLLNSCKYHMKKKAWLPNTVKIFFSILYIAQRFESWTPIPDLIPYIPRKLYANFGTFVQSVTIQLKFCVKPPDQISLSAFSLTSVIKRRKSNHLLMLEHRQHFPEPPARQTFINQANQRKFKRDAKISTIFHFVFCFQVSNSLIECYLEQELKQRCAKIFQIKCTELNAIGV